MNARDKRMEKAQMRVLFQVPFFAPGVAKMPVVWDDSVETACTDGKEIRWRPKFFDTLTDQQVVTVLAHEVAHCLLGHIWRIPPAGDWEVWNQATDHAVNNMLREFAEQVTAKNLADPFPMPGQPGDYCCDPAFRGLSEEVIYGRLTSQKPPGQKGGSKGSGSGSGKAGGQSGAQGKSSIGQIRPGPGDPAVQKRDKTDWEATLMQCVQSAKCRGEVPGCVAEFIGELLNPTVPWYELVRQWLREQAEDDWNWMRPNPYFDDGEFILPSLQSERMGPIVFATDTSGSIDITVLAHFQTEKQTCLDDLRPSKLVDILADAKVQKVHEYTVGDTIDKEAPGRGGTDFRPAFEHVATLGEAPKCLVYLTDLEGTFPDHEPDYPCLWVVYGTSAKAPFGETIKAS